MVSLMEQYETETQKSNDYPEELNPLRSGYIQASLNVNENEDIFKSQQVIINLQGRTFDQFEKCTGLMAFLMKPKTIRLFHVENKIDEILDSPDVINKFFLDSSGKHLLVATENYELYYYSRQSKKFRSISKLKGHMVTAVCWNRNCTEKVIESILIGTSRGYLFELSINTTSEGILNSSVDTYCKQIYNLGKDQSITGIEVLHFKKENNYSGPNIENIYDVVIATASCLYEFVGNDSNVSSSSASANLTTQSVILNQYSYSTTPVFTSIFSYYESKSTKDLANFFEMPIGTGQLQLRSNNRGRKKSLAWMHGGGVLLYEFDPYSLAKYSAANFHNESIKRLITENTFKNISLPQSKDDSTEEETPIGMCLTEFHLAFFLKAYVKIKCLLNEELVLNQKLDSKSLGGNTLGVWFDPASKDFGSYSSTTIIKYITNKETKKIWKIYLSKNEFEQAKQYCQDNPINLNLVLTKQAEYLFNNKNYVKSAVCYAQTQNSFEEICLKYLELGDFNALRTYLTHKLNSFEVDKEITQTTVIIAYIIEIFLNQLSDLTHAGQYDKRDVLREEFHAFLNEDSVKMCLRESRDAIYKIFASHGHIEDMIYFAELMKDYAQIIKHYIQEENQNKALYALAQQNNRDTFYKYSPILFDIAPKDMVDLWIKLGNQLNPNKLLPSLASCILNDEQVNEAIRYLEYCVNKLNSEDQSVHNNLLILYLRYKPIKLLEYVKSRKEDSVICFDELMIARLCAEQSDRDLNEACVYLYTRMSWYEEAVELALTLNVDLAKDVVNSVKSASDFIEQTYCDEIKKLLWLRIARHVIEKENDVNKAMQFLHELTESIAIEDVLPYFPEFVTIDQFKDAIRTSLANYTERINSLKENIEQAAKSAQLIRRDIQSIKQKSMTVNTTDCCSKCRYRLMSRRFYVFPCMHKFHFDCLYLTAAPYLLENRRKRIEELQKLLQDIQTIPVVNANLSSNSGVNISGNSAGASGAGVVANTLNHFSKTTSKMAQPQTYSNEEIYKLKTELDDLLANECPWCGERILKSLDEPFFDPLNYEAIYNSWL